MIPAFFDTLPDGFKGSLFQFVCEILKTCTQGQKQDSWQGGPIYGWKIFVESEVTVKKFSGKNTCRFWKDCICF